MGDADQLDYGKEREPFDIGGVLEKLGGNLLLLGLALLLPGYVNAGLTFLCLSFACFFARSPLAIICGLFFGLTL